MSSFDAIILGAGQAGPPLAGRLTKAGMKVALVERHHFGGTCVNTGCMPTKTLVASAQAAHVARRAADFGVHFDGPIRIDMAKVKSRAMAVVENARKGVEGWLRDMSGCTVIPGHARFESTDTVRVGDEKLRAPRIFINVGGRAAIPDMPGVRDIPVLTNTEMVELDRVPEHLVVIGGSYVGLEFAQMYRRFGAEVTVVEMQPRLVSREDPEVSDAIRGIFEREGIHVRANAKCIHFKRAAKGALVGVDCTDGEPEIAASDVLLAVGRRPNTDDLDLARAGVAVDEKGYVKVDDRLATNVPGIWAMGDCNGRGAFTHTSYNDFEIIAANLLDEEDRKLSQRVLGYALYIDPPLGRAGMTAALARASGASLLVGQRPMTRVGRAVEKDETQGLMKIVIDAKTQKILGAAILGPGGDEAIHGVLDIMSSGGTARDLRWAMPIHPTVAELLPTLVVEAKKPE